MELLSLRMFGASSTTPQRVLVTGGAGYVGSVLVPALLRRGHDVTAYDLFLFGDHLAEPRPGEGSLTKVRADIRDQDELRAALKGIDVVIHLACISNDPSFDLDPALSREINYECFPALVRSAKEAGVRRFIYASSSSVYGVSESPNVTEDHPLVPLTDYNRYKGLCEPILLEQQAPGFTTVVVRPATICGWSPRLRLDLTVNILTASAISRGRITVFGGKQRRPNLHIDDMVELYERLIDEPDERIGGRTYNVGYENRTIRELADMVRDVVIEEFPARGDVPIDVTDSNDLRSYHISSERIARELGFVPKRSIGDAVRDLCRAFASGLVPDPSAAAHYNVKTILAAGMR